MLQRVVLVALMTVFIACTSIRVQPLDRVASLKHVCIQENPRVIVGDFLSVVRDGFDRHGLSTEVIYGTIPERCEYVLTYTALQSWDFTTYLSHAELRLEHKGRRVADAEYHLIGKGGFSMMKWQSTKTKMDPVVDELLKAY